jgi:hypothetical protein
MRNLTLRSLRIGFSAAFALLVASEIAYLAGYGRLGHLLFWQGAKIHTWFPCDGWVGLLCVRSPVDWQYFTFGISLGILIYTLCAAIVLIGSGAVSARRTAAFRR